jgi:DNA-binding PadR family transcriptional regulator
VARDPRDLLPLKPLVFDVLLALDNGERHGWSLVRELQDGGHHTILPANFYRILRTMLGDGLIEESDRVADEGEERRRYFRLTSRGREVARLEARRVHMLANDKRFQRLLKPTARKP